MKATARESLDLIHRLIDAQEWTGATISAISVILTAAGYTVRAPLLAFDYGEAEEPGKADALGKLRAAVRMVLDAADDASSQELGQNIDWQMLRDAYNRPTQPAPSMEQQLSRHLSEEEKEARALTDAGGKPE